MDRTSQYFWGVYIIIKFLEQIWFTLQDYINKGKEQENGNIVNIITISKPKSLCSISEEEVNIMILELNKANGWNVQKVLQSIKVISNTSESEILSYGDY